MIGIETGRHEGHSARLMEHLRAGVGRRLGDAFHCQHAPPRPPLQEQEVECLTRIFWDQGV